MAAGLEMRCADRDVPVPVVGMRPGIHCSNRSVLAHILGMGLEMKRYCTYSMTYACACVNHTDLVPVLAMGMGLEMNFANRADFGAEIAMHMVHTRMWGSKCATSPAPEHPLPVQSTPRW